MNRSDRKQPAPWAIFVVLFILFPPLAIVGLVAFLGYQQAKKKGKVNAESFQTAKETFLRRMKEEDVAERPYQSQPHAHTPVSYSYDICAREKRLEQLKVLKSAGLLDEVEYQQRRQEILK